MSFRGGFHARRRAPFMNPLVGSDSSVEVATEKALRVAVNEAVQGAGPAIIIVDEIWITDPLVIANIKGPVEISCLGRGLLGTEGANNLIEVGAANSGFITTRFQEVRLRDMVLVGGTAGAALYSDTDGDGEASPAIRVDGGVITAQGGDAVSGVFSQVALRGVTVLRDMALSGGLLMVSGCRAADITIDDTANNPNRAMIANSWCGDVTVNSTQGLGVMSVTDNVARVGTPTIDFTSWSGATGLIDGNNGFTVNAGSATTGTNV